jgi:hypothetical protein
MMRILLLLLLISSPCISETTFIKLTCKDWGLFSIEASSIDLDDRLWLKPDNIDDATYLKNNYDLHPYPKKAESITCKIGKDKFYFKAKSRSQVISLNDIEIIKGFIITPFNSTRKSHVNSIDINMESTMVKICQIPKKSAHWTKSKQISCKSFELNKQPIDITKN